MTNDDDGRKGCEDAETQKCTPTTALKAQKVSAFHQHKCWQGAPRKEKLEG